MVCSDRGVAIIGDPITYSLVRGTGIADEFRHPATPEVEPDSIDFDMPLSLALAAEFQRAGLGHQPACRGTHATALR